MDIVFCDSQNAQRLFRPIHFGLRFGELTLGLIECSSRRGFVLEQFFRASKRLLGEIEILVRLDVLRQSSGDVAAVNGKQHLAFFHVIADFDSEVLHLSRHRRNDVGQLVFIELHFAGCHQVRGHWIFLEYLHLDAGQHSRIQLESLAHLVRGFRRCGICRLARRGTAECKKYRDQSERRK